SSDLTGTTGGILTQESANDALDMLDGAINKVSMQRAKIGAQQNRLEHTINNLARTGENLTAAEWRIRDADMAKEIMKFTKYNILTHASMTMLTQAHKIPHAVLQLLQ